VHQRTSTINPVDKMKVDRIVPEAISLIDDATHITGKRHPVNIISDNGSYTPGQKITIRPPRTADGLTDFSQHWITFTATASATAATYLRFTQGIASLFDQVNIYVGSTQIEQIQNYGIYHNAWTTRNESDWFFAGGGSQNAGYGTVAQRTAWAPSHKYKVKLLCGFMNDIIPTSMMSQDIRVEIVLAQAAQVLVTDGTAPTFTVSNVYLQYHDLIPESGYMETLRAKCIGGPGLIKGYQSTESYVLPGLSGTSVNQELPFKYTYFKGILAVILNTSKLTDLTGAVSPASGPGDTKTVDYPFATQATFQLQVNSTQYPATSVVSTDGVEPYRFYRGLIYKDTSDAASYAGFN
jgi:hypothetical protein